MENLDLLLNLIDSIKVFFKVIPHKRKKQREQYNFLNFFYIEVKSASVETVETADVPYPGAEVGDKYIDFVVNTKEGSGVADTHIYIPVDDLMAAITGGTTADISVSIDAHNVITASVNNILASKVVYQGTQANPTETVLEALTRLDGPESTTDSIREIVKNEYIEPLEDINKGSEDIYPDILLILNTS